MTRETVIMQADDSIRHIRNAKAGQRVMYFCSDANTGLLMECRQRAAYGKLLPIARDADEIASVAFGLAHLGFGYLTQERWGQRDGDTEFRFKYYITLGREITPSDIKRAREVERPLFAIEQ